MSPTNIVLFASHNNFNTNLFKQLSNRINVKSWVFDADTVKSRDAKIQYENHWDLLKNKSYCDDDCEADYITLNLIEHSALINILLSFDRYDYKGSFTLNEKLFWIFNYLNKARSDFEKLEIDALIFSNVPHDPVALCYYYLAKSKGLVTLILMPSLLKGHSLIRTAIDAVPLSQEQSLVDETELRRKLISDFEKRDKKPIWYMQKKDQGFFKVLNLRSIEKWGKLIWGKAGPIFQTLKTNTNAYDLTSKSFRSEVLKRWKMMRWQKSLKNEYKKFACDYVDGKFVYFALHYQPEMTTVPLSGYYAEQISTAIKISKALPADTKLYVKEHPDQFRTGLLVNAQGRFKDYWRSLSQCPNIRLVNTDVDTTLLMDRSIAVATLTGTAGWEALVNEKPVICSSGAWYAGVPGVINIADTNFRERIKTILNENWVAPDHDTLFEYCRNKFIPGRISFVNSASLEKIDLMASLISKHLDACFAGQKVEIPKN